MAFSFVAVFERGDLAADINGDDVDAFADVLAAASFEADMGDFVAWFEGVG